MLDFGSEETRGEKLYLGTSSGALFPANFIGTVNLRCGFEERPAARRIWGIDALEV